MRPFIYLEEDAKTLRFLGVLFVASSLSQVSKSNPPAGAAVSARSDC